VCVLSKVLIDFLSGRIFVDRLVVNLNRFSLQIHSNLCAHYTQDLSIKLVDMLCQQIDSICAREH